MKKALLLFLLTFGGPAHGDVSLRVLDTVQVAGIRLRLTRGAQKRIQEKVDSLTRNQKYLQNLLDRASLFIPLIEGVLRAEEVPLDFKYLAIQESELISDAVSSSNTVGFWQFKESTAKEVGLQINRHVDERMHITAATRAAAQYLQQGNLAFNNWLYALLAYHEGRTGAQKWIKSRYLGARSMRIEPQVHTYIVHFLAYKVVFDAVLGKKMHPKYTLYEYPEVHGKSLDEISLELGVDRDQVKRYNKWLKRHRVPQDSTCCAIIPMTHRQYAHHCATLKGRVRAQRYGSYTKHHRAEAAKFPIVKKRKRKQGNREVTIINHKAGVVAVSGDNLTSLSKAGNITLTRFLAYNDLHRSHRVVPGQVYYYVPKRNRARVRFHIVQSGDTWWSIAQKYGVRKKALLRRNRLRKETVLKINSVVWLRFIRPARVSMTYNDKKCTLGATG